MVVVVGALHAREPSLPLDTCLPTSDTRAIMHNIELKARLQDMDAAHAAARELCGKGPDAVLHQTDTYFRVSSGRLKLREIVSQEGGDRFAELIFYERANDAGPKKCDYEITAVCNPAELERTLSAALGIRTVVIKERTLFLYQNVRIHLDRVETLGAFLEFEAVMSDGVPEDQGEPLVAELTQRFGIADGDLVCESYVDLLERRRRVHHVDKETKDGTT